MPSIRILTRIALTCVVLAGSAQAQPVSRHAAVTVASPNKGALHGMKAPHILPSRLDHRMPADTDSDSRAVNLGFYLGALVGGLVAAEDCRRQDCYVPVVPVAIGVLVGAGVGGLIGLLIGR